MALTIAATVDDSQGRTRIDMSGLKALPAATTMTLTRVPPSGTVVSVRGASEVAIPGDVDIVYDYERPPGVALQYKVTLYDVNGAVVTSAITPVATWASKQAWLKDPFHPNLNVKATVVVYDVGAWALTTGVFRVLNRRMPIVVSDVRQAPTGTISLFTEFHQDWENMLELLSSGNVLLFQAPFDDYMVGNLYLTVANVGEVRLTRAGNVEARRWDLAVIEVDRPAAEALSYGDARYLDVTVAYATYRLVLAGEPTYLDLLEGPGTTVPIRPKPPLPWRGQ